MTTIPWSQLKASAEDPGDFTPLRPGNYPARVESVEVKETRTGKPMFSLTWVVTSGPDAGRKTWSNIVLSAENPKSMGFFFKDMATLGADAAFFDAEPSLAEVAARIQQAQANVIITVRPQRNDPTRLEVSRISPQTSATASAPAAPSFAAAQPVAPAPAAPAPARRSAPARPF
jgi:hypothetical protein